MVTQNGTEWRQCVIENFSKLFLKAREKDSLKKDYFGWKTQKGFQIDAHHSPPIRGRYQGIETLNSDTLGKSCRYSWGDYDICDKYDNNCNDSDHNH